MEDVRKREHRRQLSHHRAARHSRRPAHLLRRLREGALPAFGRQALPPSRALDWLHLRRAHRDWRARRRPVVPRAESRVKQLSYVRFLYVAMHRPRFRVGSGSWSSCCRAWKTTAAAPCGRSLACKFTGLKLPRGRQAFSREQGIHPAAFSAGRNLRRRSSRKNIQDAIGEVGPSTQGAKAMLTKIGFRYDERIDPFDGGPHFSAPTEARPNRSTDSAARASRRSGCLKGQKSSPTRSKIGWWPLNARKAAIASGRCAPCACSAMPRCGCRKTPSKLWKPKTASACRPFPSSSYQTLSEGPGA